MASRLCRRGAVRYLSIKELVHWLVIRVGLCPVRPRYSRRRNPRTVLMGQTPPTMVTFFLYLKIPRRMLTLPVWIAGWQRLTDWGQEHQEVRKGGKEATTIETWAVLLREMIGPPGMFQESG